jgi:hypothetical protein
MTGNNAHSCLQHCSYATIGVHILPFLKSNKNKMITTLLDRRVNGHRVPVNPVVESKNHPDHDPELEAACVKLLDAIDHRSIEGIRDALVDAHQACDKQLHEEGPHSNESEPAEPEEQE